MARKNRTPEEKARREKIRELLQMANIGSMEDIQSLFKETIAEFMENGLEAELDDELGYSKYDYKNKDTDNSRNGHSSKTLRTSFGDVEVSVPRDRKGEFEPQVLKKNQTSISQDIEEKILSMYAKGMTTGDIETHIQDIYGISVSDSTVSRITDKILPVAKEWQQRPLESIYAVVFLDAIHYHVRSEGQIVKKAVYIAIGIDLDGRKDVLGMWVGENESAKFWATVFNGLKNRGIKIVSDGTDNHLMLVDLTPFDLTGKAIEKLLDEAHITANKNTIPNDPKSPFVTSGIRLGTPSVTSRGMNTEDMDKIAEAISIVIKEGDEGVTKARAIVDELTAKYPLKK